MFASTSPFLVAAFLGLSLCVAALACTPQPTAPPTPEGDPFAIVRATSEAAYQSGKALLDRGDLRGCPAIDVAKTNDPDNRADIQQALEQCLAALAEPPTSAPAAARAAVQTPLALPPTVPLAATATPVPAKPTPAASPALIAAATATSAPAANLQTWSDPQGRFSIGAPRDWNRADQPQALFGTAAVEFHDSSGRASLGVAVDANGRAVSPELYAASMELSMQQLPGYALEQVLPGSTAGSPSIRRTFTFTQRDGAGRELNARGFQVTVLKGSTPYIIAGSAPANEFAQFGALFDQMVDSFRFS